MMCKNIVEYNLLENNFLHCFEIITVFFLILEYKTDLRCGEAALG